MKILTAFKDGGIYRPYHVDRLAKQVKEHSGLDLLSINSKYPHWWCKINLFQIEGPVLYFDLDTTIVDDITPLIDEVYRHEFLILRDFNRPTSMGSGVMGWSGDVSHLYRYFNPEVHIHDYPGGDQGYIQDTYEGHVSYWQDELPNMIQSYKCHVRRNSIHPDCRVVAFHGNPRPWAIPELTKE